MRAVFILSSVLALTLVSASHVHGQAPRPGGERLGTVHFETSCAPSTRQEFDHAIALLHSFEFPEAIGAKSEREREYIAAVALLYKGADTLDHRARTLAYEKAMAQIHAKYPKDLEAAAFYALSVDQTALPTDKTYANQLKAAAILEKLYKLEPDHPGVTHYLIHSYDVPALAPRALPYARKYANLPPDPPPPLPIPAHPFPRVSSC